MFSNVSARSGSLQRRERAVITFEPAALPPSDLSLSPLQWRSVTDAERAIGRLQGLLEGTAWPRSLAKLAVLQEAIASARLEGQTLQLSDLLWWELDGRVTELGPQAGALRLASQHAQLLYLLDPNRPLHDLSQLHKKLYRNVRGRDAVAGQLRDAVIWLGPRGSTATDAPFVPPGPEMLSKHIKQLEAFVEQARQWPRVVHAALAYYQAETLQPFLDGSGRVARILLTSCLLESGTRSSTLLLRPSLLWTRDTAAHFRRLQSLREHGDFEEWITAFSRSIEHSCQQATSLLHRVSAWLTGARHAVLRELPNQRHAAIQILDAMPARPLIDIQAAAEMSERNFANANIVVQRLLRLGILKEITGRRRNRRFVAPGLLEALEEKVADGQ